MAARLSEGGEQGPCGWAEDRFGLAWQIVAATPTSSLLTPTRSARTACSRRCCEMKKIEIDGLERAAVGSLTGYSGPACSTASPVRK